MKLYKVIIKGHLGFGNERSFENAVKMLNWRVEAYHKRDLLVDPEELFDDNDNTLKIPRLVLKEIPKKNWKSTIDLLKFTSQYALSGDLEGWLIGEKGIVEYVSVEPDSERSVVQKFKKGRELLKKGGIEDAKKALDTSIKKFSNHALAYERRAHVSIKLGKHQDALEDYTKSIDLYSLNPDAYYGRGILYFLKEEYEKAIIDFDDAVKNSIPLQPVYWKARRRKGESLQKIGKFEEAKKEYKFYLKRNFINESNMGHRRRVFFNLGRVLLELEEFEEAYEAFSSSYSIENGRDNFSPEERLFYRGVAGHLAGKPGFWEDLKKAKEADYLPAKEYIEAQGIS